MISLFTSAVNTTTSLVESPTLMTPPAPALRYALPSTRKSPCTCTSLSNVATSRYCVVPYKYTSGMTDIGCQMVVVLMFPPGEDTYCSSRKPSCHTIFLALKASNGISKLLALSSPDISTSPLSTDTPVTCSPFFTLKASCNVWSLWLIVMLHFPHQPSRAGG